jgi:hypothetical protein
MASPIHQEFRFTSDFLSRRTREMAVSSVVLGTILLTTFTGWQG